MVQHDFPLFRLATLLARQLSSPVASKIKDHVRVHPLFTRTLCMRTARTFRAAELRLKLWSLRLPQPASLPPISDREATDVGADLLGEMVIFALGAAIITFEVNRQASNKAAAKLERKSRWVAIGVSLEELQRELVLQQQEMDALMTTLRGLQPGPGPETQLDQSRGTLSSLWTEGRIPQDTPATDLPHSTSTTDLPHGTSAVDLPLSPELKDSSPKASSEQVHKPHVSPKPPPLDQHPPRANPRRPVYCYPGETPRPRRDPPPES